MIPLSLHEIELIVELLYRQDTLTPREQNLLNKLEKLVILP